MKTFIHMLSILMSTVMLFAAQKPTDHRLELPNGYYVIIQRFTDFYAADAYSDRIFKRGFEQTGVGYDGNANQYVVFVYKTESAAEAEEKKAYFKSSNIFPSAKLVEVTNSYQSNMDVEQPVYLPVKTADKPEPEPIEDPKSQPIAEPESQPIAEPESQPIAEPEPEPIADDVEIKDYFYFLPSVYNARNMEPLDGKVDYVDVMRARKITTLKNDEIFKIEKGETPKVKLMVDHFGYKKTEIDVNLEVKPEDGINYRISNDTVYADLGLLRFEKGDIMVMYNVFFWSDAAVMKESSLYELKELLKMLKENPDYEIIVHGHTNGNSTAKIYTVEEGSTDYFNRSPSNDEGIGSAKTLSEERANVIKKWLILNGIDGKRIETKGWGGRKPLFDKSSPQASKNLRVEVEVVEDGS